MTNNTRPRKNGEKRSRPKSWCAPCSRADLNNAGVLSNGGLPPKPAVWYVNKCEETDSFDVVNHEFVYRKMSCSGNNSKFTVSATNGSLSPAPYESARARTMSPIRYDDNNNIANTQTRYAADVPKVIRRNNVDRNARRAVVSLNLDSQYRTNVDPCGLSRTKKCRPKSIYQNIFRRSCNFVKCHIFGDNSRQKNYPDATLTSYQNENIFIKNSDKMMTGTIITDGESCMFNEGTVPINGICIPYNGIYTHQENQENIPTSDSNVCQGFSVGTNESKVQTLTNLMPWTKRDMPEVADVSSEEFQTRRESRKFSSLRSPSKLKRQTSSPVVPTYGTMRSDCSPSQSSYILKRHSSDNLRSSRGSSAKFCRNNSVDGSLSRKSLHSPSLDRVTDENIKNISPKSKNKKGESRNAPNFFIRYQDVLREDKVTDTPIASDTDYVDTSKFTQINEVFEYILNLHCSKPVTKTCKQLFYIRSRLSKNARKNNTMCDGCFGCDGEGGHVIKAR